MILWELSAPKLHNAIASDFRIDGAKSPEILQKEGVLGSEVAARNRRSLVTFHRTLKSQCSIAFGDRCDFWGPRRDGHRNRKSQKSLRFSALSHSIWLSAVAAAFFALVKAWANTQNPKGVRFDFKLFLPLNQRRIVSIFLNFGVGFSGKF